MAFHNLIGKRGEEIAVAILRQKGYTIEQTNWRLGHLEVDIIASNKDEIVFAEVKTRTSTFGGKMPEESVDRVKRARLVAAANAYIKYHRIEKKPRFDIIGILLEKNTGEILMQTHLEDAFIPALRTIHANSYSGQYKWKHRRRVIK